MNSKNTLLTNASASGTFNLGGDLPVHRIGFGAMRITGDGIWGEPKDRESAKRLLRRVVELGINFIDTADSYGPEVSETLIAEALHPYPAGLVIATKGGLTRSGPSKWAPVGRPEYLQQCVELSLRRLRVERIDLYQLHRIDPKVPVAETIGALKDLQQQGKIRHLGLSEVSVAEIKQVQKLADVISVQNRYNIGDRAHENVVTWCEKNGLGFIPWFPIAAGDLAKPGGTLDAISKRHGVAVGQLAWPGSSVVRRICCRFREPLQSPILRKISVLPASSFPMPSGAKSSTFTNNPLHYDVGCELEAI